MNKLFFELIRLTIGTSNSLSRQPSTEEWQTLYKMAVKQCLVGICFAGVRRLVEADKEGRAGIPKQVYYNWMGMAANIQLRNELLNEHCGAFERLLKKNGYQSCVLKRQGIASLYKVVGLGCRDEGTSLAGLRQSGDIDTWALGEPREVIEWARQTGAMTFYDYHHADLL